MSVVQRFIDSTLTHFGKTFTPEETELRLLSEIRILQSQLVNDLHPKVREEKMALLKIKEENLSEILNENK